MKESFYELLREYRGRSGLSFCTLADLAITSPGYLHRLFEGRHKPSRDFLIRLALALNLSVEDADYLLREGGFYGLLEKNPILASNQGETVSAPTTRARSDAQSDR
jgi:transcriptional regulator with XRE-family HTH domain